MDVTGQTAGQGILEAILRVGSMVPEPSFRLEASSLHVEVDVADPAINAGGTWHGVDPTTELSDYEAAHVTGTAVREGFRWLVLPPEGARPEATIATACLKAGTQGPSGPWTPKAKLERGSLEPDSGDAAAIAACTGHLTLRGEFTLVLWEWDATLRAQGETRHLWSGARASSKDPLGTPESGEVIQEFREVYLYASDAVLQVPLDEQDVLYLRDAGLQVDGSIFLQHASGSLLAGSQFVEVEDADVYVRGDLDVDIAPSDSRLGVGVDGVLQQVQVDGQSVSLTSAAAAPNVEGGVWWTAGLALVFSVAGLAWWAWQRPLHVYRNGTLIGADTGSLEPNSRREERGVGHKLLGRKANRRGRHWRSLRHAQHAYTLFPLLPEVRVLRSVALGHVGRYKEAVADALDVYDLVPDREARGELAANAATCCAKLGLEKACCSWLIVAVRELPDVAASLVDAPAYDVFGDASWLQDLRRRPPAGHGGGFVDPGFT